MANKKNDNNKNAPAWARYNGETYKSEFYGTAEQKKAHDKIVDELLSKRSRGKRGGGK